MFSHSFVDNHLQKGTVYFSLPGLPLGVPLYTANGHMVTRTAESEVIVKSDDGAEKAIVFDQPNNPAERHHLFVWEHSLLSDGWLPCTLTESEHGILSLSFSETLSFLFC